MAVKLFYGAAIIEILIAIAVLALVLTSVLGLAGLSLQSAGLVQKTVAAVNLAQEAMEATRSFRDAIAWQNDDPQNQYDGLGALTPGAFYHPAKSQDAQPKWMLLSGQETLYGFSRKIVFENVSRDSNENIESVYNSSNNDPNTKKAIVSVSWYEKGRPHSVQLNTYLTNWR